MTEANGAGTLVKISDSVLEPINPDEDVRHRKVLDRNGEEVGTVDDLLVDEAERRVRLLRVAHGGFLGIGTEHFLVPVDAVTRIDDEAVHIDRTRETMADTPGYDPALDEAAAPAYYGGVYDWWGYGPYWMPGYVAPPYPVNPDQDEIAARNV